MLVGTPDEAVPERNGLRADAIDSLPSRPSAGVIGRRKHNLRAQPTQIVGRAGELKLASQVLLRDDVRLVTFTGPAGTGKTRLSLALAESLVELFTDGVFFVDLARLDDPSLVSAAIAETLGIREGRDKPLLERLEGVLFDRHVLLVLDNFEHVLAAADQVADLLAVCPDLKILATSRAPLRLRWEHVFPIFPLPLPARDANADVARVAESPAVQLFVERARAAEPGFALTEQNAATLAEVCMRLDGLPLAIELAAARTRVLPPEALLTRLRNRLEVLIDGARDLPVRQRTLREAIGYSYDLLGDDERALFCQLSIFAGGCTVEAAAAIMAEPLDEVGARPAVLDRLQSLVDKSLLQRDQLPGGEVRFRMLETIREYAHEQLARAGGLAGLRDRWIDYLLELTHRSRNALLGREQAATLAMLDREHDNLRAALRACIEAGDAERGLQLAAALWRYWFVRGFFTEGRTWLSELLALPGATARTTLRANALSAAGNLAYNQGDDAAAEAFQTESLAIRRELGDRGGVAVSLDTLGALAFRRGDCERANSLLEESLLVKREREDRWGIAAALHHLGDVALEQGHFSTARARYEDSLVQWAELGDIWSIAMVLESLAGMAQARGNPARALKLVGAASALRERLHGAPMPPVQRAQQQKLIEAVQGSLGTEAATAALAEGRAMGFEQAISYARAADEPAPTTKVAAESPTALPAQGPLAWLTPREREVAGLLLRGMSNRQIAEDLVITERTAETHVCRILSKLGLDSRAQIAAWVIDNGLLETRAVAVPSARAS
jgi:predicted ATPase/DNA-binding CsgD family transcriptional regulator